MKRKSSWKNAELAALTSAALLAGCASLVHERQQTLRLEALTADGVVVIGAECTLRNDRESMAARSGTVVSIRRSAADLQIVCRHRGHPDATANLISRSNAQMKSNAFFLFGIGAVFDHRSGAGYTYPGWVQLVFGQRLVFDRKDDQDSAPTKPRMPTRDASSASLEKTP